MKQKRFAIKFSVLLFVAVLALVQVIPALAADQTITGTATAGNLRITVKDNGAMKVAQYTGSAWQENVYPAGGSADAKGSNLCIVTASYSMGGNSTWPPTGTVATYQSNVSEGTGTALDPWTITTQWTMAAGITVTQVTAYVDGNSWYTMTWTVNNATGGDVADLRFFTGQDTMLAGSDSGSGWWDATVGTGGGSVGVTHPTSGQEMWLQTVLGSSSTHHESRQYSTANSHRNACALDDTVTASIHDNGYALEWQNATLTNGSDWVFSVEEHFMLTGGSHGGGGTTTVTSISPTDGPTAGGTTVTINGTNFVGVTSVTIGGNAVTCAGPNTSTALTNCTTPAHAAGTVSATVTGSGGAGTGGSFTYHTPTVTSFTTNTDGRTAGGTTVTINGNYFTGFSSVTIGGTAATCGGPNSDTLLTCTTPAHLAGVVVARVTNPVDYGEGGTFTYHAPTIDSTPPNPTPNTGPVAGGQSVTITGTWLNTTFQFGSGPTQTCVVSGATFTSAVCTTLAHAAGIVSVSNISGPVTVTEVDHYAYIPPPTISGVSQDLGPTTGGTPEVITGTNFSGSYTTGTHTISWTTTILTFGGTAPSSYTVNSATQITTTTPAHVAGTVSVAATTPGGTTAANTLFTYVQGATLGLTPNFGPAAGGTTVTIVGTGVGSATAVRFGGPAGSLGTSLTILNPTHITVVTPAHAAGTVDVVIEVPGDDLVAPLAYTFVPAAVAGVSPSSGPTAGGTTVVITGSYDGTSVVTFGGSTATCSAPIPLTSISCTTPPHAAGTYNVVVTGTGAATFTNAFTFVPPDLFADIYPNYGPIAGGTTVVITGGSGTNFTGATSVTFGGAAVTSFTVNSPTQITAVTPAHAVGLVSVIITAPAATYTYASSFTFYGSSMPLAPLSDPITGSYLFETENITQLEITFNMDMLHVGSGGPDWASSALNPANYMLVNEGPNEAIDTQTCLIGPQGDDWNVSIDSVDSYNPATFTVVLNVNHGQPLPANGTTGTVGQYRLFACGTTSIKNLAGVKLNGGLDDTRFNFVILPAPAALPATGFAPNRVTALPVQTVSYADLGDLWLEIPALGVQMPIVGVPQTDGAWDVSWLGNDAGWLDGSAFPTWAGNSVLTGHVYDAFGNPGPFAGLNRLWWGSQVIVHAWGGQYVYEVRAVMQVAPGNTAAMLKHQELPWLTLVTCRGYDEASNSYKTRVLVRAVLVEEK